MRIHVKRPLRAPMLVTRGLNNTELELRERAAVKAFELGYADREHFDTLCVMQGIMLLAGTTSITRMAAKVYCMDVLGPVLYRIRQRYDRTGKFDITTGDRKVLREFPTKYREFWLRQPTELYEAATIAYQQKMAEIKAQRAKEKEHAGTV